MDDMKTPAVVVFAVTMLCYIPLTFAWQDSDGDGVPDAKDACPGTPAGVVVDAAGCKRESQQALCLKTRAGDLFPKTCQQMTALSIQFAFAKADVAMSQWTKLALINRFLQQHDVSLALIGYTDNVGESQFNLSLSKQRAANIKAILVEDFGHDPARLTIDGMGTEHPVASNDTDLGRSLNRRVEFVVETK
ncbi:OmpA family protein [Shewanella waksmanii]|uniref:OmpA family protein n=1 Tax=Shewanella waksmanii TaxID=213783 RepID=UPI0004ACEADA|nr:OmpA family protein [Shewanella waksmanii]